MAIGIFEGIINAIISTINIITGTLSKLWTWAFGENSRIPEITWRADWKIPYLANGGMVNAGSMFVAGERGAELVTNLGSGQTGVMNVAQFTEAVVNGIARSGVIEAIKEGGNIYLDNERVGTKVGNSKGLRQALNRTNPTLDLK
jgi:ABC-type enterochelin transport system permease subunit